MVLNPRMPAPRRGAGGGTALAGSAEAGWAADGGGAGKGAGGGAGGGGALGAGADGNSIAVGGIGKGECVMADGMLPKRDGKGGGRLVGSGLA